MIRLKVYEWYYSDYGNNDKIKEMYMLTLENLSFGVQEERKEKEIIHDLTLTIGEHKFVVITGPNGGGKIGRASCRERV